MLTLRIDEVLEATPRARIVRIELNGRPFPYLPGQALRVATHGHERRRPYSIAVAPSDAERTGRLELLVGVDDEGNAGSHLTLKLGTLIDVEGPVGQFTFPAFPEEERFVFIAGGTGIAPLRSMLYHALHVPHRTIGLLYSARTPQDFAYAQELKALADQNLINLKMNVTREVGEEWRGGRGRIGHRDLLPLIHDPATLCFICGPPTLVDQMPRVLRDLGVSDHRTRMERQS